MHLYQARPAQSRVLVCWPLAAGRWLLAAGVCFIRRGWWAHLDAAGLPCLANDLLSPILALGRKGASSFDESPQVPLQAQSWPPPLLSLSTPPPHRLLQALQGTHASVFESGIVYTHLLGLARRTVPSSPTSALVTPGAGKGRFSTPHSALLPWRLGQRGQAIGSPGQDLHGPMRPAVSWLSCMCPVGVKQCGMPRVEKVLEVPASSLGCVLCRI